MIFWFLLIISNTQWSTTNVFFPCGNNYDDIKLRAMLICTYIFYSSLFCLKFILYEFKTDSTHLACQHIHVNYILILWWVNQNCVFTKLVVFLRLWLSDWISHMQLEVLLAFCKKTTVFPERVSCRSNQHRKQIDVSTLPNTFEVVSL